MSILNCPCCNLSWQHFVQISMGNRNVFPSCMWQPFMYLETDALYLQPFLPQTGHAEFLSSFCKARPQAVPKTLLESVHKASPFSKHGPCLHFYVPVGHLPFSQQHSIDSLIRCTPRFLFVKGLASQQVPILYFQDDYSYLSTVHHTCPYALVPFILLRLFPFHFTKSI